MLTHAFNHGRKESASHTKTKKRSLKPDDDQPISRHITTQKAFSQLSRAEWVLAEEHDA